MSKNKTYKRKEHITAVRFVHYFSKRTPHGLLSLSGENAKGTFCRLIPCKIRASGEKYGLYHNHTVIEGSRDFYI